MFKLFPSSTAIKAAWLSFPLSARIAICASWLVAGATLAFGLKYLGSLHAPRYPESRAVAAETVSASHEETASTAASSAVTAAAASQSAKKAASSPQEISKSEAAEGKKLDRAELARNSDRPAASPRSKVEDGASSTIQRTSPEHVENPEAKLTADETTSNKTTADRITADDAPVDKAPVDKAPADSDADKTSKAGENSGDAGAAASVNPAQPTIDRAVEALLRVMKDKDNPLGYVFPPVSQRKFDHYDEVPYHYSSQMVTVPIYDTQYDTAMVTRAVTEGTRVMMQTVPERRIVSRRQIGTRQEPRLVADPNGPIVRMVRQPVWTDGGPDLEREGWLGDNAMALLALLRNGVTPQKEPIVARVAERLSNHISAFGSPDSTWDLAWAMIALDEYPGSQFDSMVDRLYGRLLSGQISQGPGKGLWGPVCVNPALLARVGEEFYANQVPGMAAGNNRMAARLPMQNAAGQAGAMLNPLQTQAQAVQERLFIAFTAVSLNAPRFADAIKSGILKDAHGLYGNDVMTSGWPVNLYREATADLDSTALAVYALRVVAASHKLPDSVDFPEKLDLASRFSTRDALVAALLALSQAQREDGSWDEMVRWQAVEEFSNGAPAQFGLVIEPAEKLPSQITPVATAEACNAMEDILYALERIEPPKKGRSAARGQKVAKAVRPVKQTKLSRPSKPVKLAELSEYRQQISKGRRRLLEMMAQASKGQFQKLVPKADQGDMEGKVVGRRRFDHLRTVVEPSWGGILEPYATLCQLRLGEKSENAAEGEDQDRAAVLTYLASQVALQDASGLWPSSNNALHWTPSSRERAIYLVTQYAAGQTGNPAAPAAKKAGQAARNQHAKPSRAGKKDDVPIDEKVVETALTAYYYRAQLEFYAGDAAKLATVHMLHYLSGAMTGAAVLEKPATTIRSPRGDGPASAGEEEPKAKEDSSDAPSP